MKNLRLGILAGTVSVLALMAPANASIVTVTGFFTSDHCGGGGTAGCLVGQTNGGSVSVTGSNVVDNSATPGSLTFNVSLANGNQFINAGFDASFGFNLPSIAQVTYSAISPVTFTIPGGVGLTQTNGNLHMDGTGFFDFGLNAPGTGGSGGGQGSTLSFIVTAPGLDLLDLGLNANGQYAAADIISTSAGGAPRTGGIDVSSGLSINPVDVEPVPEPASLAIFGAGLIGLGGLKWLRRRKQDVA